eukprot:jgi/Tetstr1/442009/TSEL_030190.t1
MEREAEAASGSQKELTAFLDQANNSRLRNEVYALPATCRERILLNQLDAASGMWTVAIPTARTVMTPHELREVTAGYFFLPSPCLAPVVGSQVVLPSTEYNPVTADLYGDALINLPAPGDAHWRVQHDAIADAFRDHYIHDQELSLPAFVVTGSYDPRSLKPTLSEFKTMRYGVKYTAVPRAPAVDRFERSLLGDIQRGLAARDPAWHNMEPGEKGPLRNIMDMSEYTGMVFGTMGEDVEKINLLQCHLTCVKYNGIRPDDVYFFNCFPHGSSNTITVSMYKTVKKEIERRGEALDTVWFQLDNTCRENKNKCIMCFC